MPWEELESLAFKNQKYTLYYYSTDLAASGGMKHIPPLDSAGITQDTKNAYIYEQSSLVQSCWRGWVVGAAAVSVGAAVS